MILVLELPTNKRLFLLELLGHIDYVKLIGELPEGIDANALELMMGDLGGDGINLSGTPKVKDIKD